MNFILKLILFFSFAVMSIGMVAQPPAAKGKTKAKNENVKEDQKKALLKQQKEFRKKHYNRQSKEVKKRMKGNLKSTDKYYKERKKPLIKRIFKKKYKH